MITRAKYLNLRSRRQSGVALIVALVVLVIVALTSASVMRGALSADLVANNTRVQTLAAQAAHIALRYCENELQQNVPTVTVLSLGATPQFENMENWADGSTKIKTIDPKYMSSDLSTFKPDKMPQCMVEEHDLNGDRAYRIGQDALQVTARGFSPDYQVEDGKLVSGSVVWVQSLIAN